MSSLDSNKQWHTSVVERGDRTGKKFVYPTVNLDPAVMLDDTKRGVYVSRVKIGDQPYQGVLYFGPRLVMYEEHDVLEIYLLDFNDQIYGEEVAFTLEKYIRPVQDFPNLKELKKQVSKDIKIVKEVFNEG